MEASITRRAKFMLTRCPGIQHPPHPPRTCSHTRTLDPHAIEPRLPPSHPAAGHRWGPAPPGPTRGAGTQAGDDDLPPAAPASAQGVLGFGVFFGLVGFFLLFLTCFAFGEAVPRRQSGGWATISRPANTEGGTREGGRQAGPPSPSPRGAASPRRLRRPPPASTLPAGRQPRAASFPSGRAVGPRPPPPSCRGWPRVGAQDPGAAGG